MGNTLEEAKSAPVRKLPIRTTSFAETPTWCMNNNNDNSLTLSCLKIKLQ